MKNKLTQRFATAVFVVLTLVGGAMSAAAASESATVAATALGKIIVDGKGMTAYFFDNDTANSGTSTCAGPCATAWPAITSTSDTPAAIGITGTIGTITRVTGEKQLTINGRPIYTFANDKAPGDVNGQGVKGVWYVISPSGEEIIATAAEVAGESAKAKKAAGVAKAKKAAKKSKKAKITKPSKAKKVAKTTRPKKSKKSIAPKVSASPSSAENSVPSTKGNY